MQKNNANTAVLALIFLASAVVVIGGLAVIPAFELVQESEARPLTTIKSCDAGGAAFNASQGRCFHP